MRIWSEKTITDALSMFTLTGEAIVACESQEHAQRFRMAVYNYIRRKNLSVEIQLSISGTDVCFHLPRMERAEVKEAAQ